MSAWSENRITCDTRTTDNISQQFFKRAVPQFFPIPLKNIIDTVSYRVSTANFASSRNKPQIDFHITTANILRNGEGWTKRKLAEYTIICQQLKPQTISYSLTQKEETTSLPSAGDEELVIIEVAYLPWHENCEVIIDGAFGTISLIIQTL